MKESLKHEIVTQMDGNANIKLQQKHGYQSDKHPNITTLKLEEDDTQLESQCHRKMPYKKWQRPYETMPLEKRINKKDFK